MLRLAAKWGRIEKAATVELVAGERPRELVLSDNEVERYVTTCPQPSKDCATVMHGTGMRPGEVFCMRWENIILDGDGSRIRILGGKTTAAQRSWPMVPGVHSVLTSRHESQGRPAEGCAFAAPTETGHITGSSVKDQHKRALMTTRIKPFEPYCLRHTTLTNIAALGGDVFALARIAGHGRISVTERYVHPGEDAVEGVFASFGRGGHNFGHTEKKGLSKAAKRKA